MKTDQCQNVMEIMNQIEGVNLHPKKGGRFFFPMYVNKQMEEAPIECLELGVRSYNCLKRAGFNNVAELAEATADGQALKHIRNCGTKSAREIMERMFIYQYEILSPERRKHFLQDVVDMNKYMIDDDRRG